MPFLKLYKNIAKGIEVEKEHDYINFDGQRSNFQNFILNSIKKLGKIYLGIDKSKIKNIELCFEQYEFDSLSGRMNSVSMFEKYLAEIYKIYKEEEKKQEIRKKYEEKLKELLKDKKRPENIEIDLVKGVGDKTAQLLNKVGIRNVDDLFRYLPRKYINYKQTTKISDLRIGETVSIIGYIKNTHVRNLKNNFSLLTVVLSDDIKDIEIGYFYKNASRGMLNRYRAMYPTDATVVASGIVKLNSYTRKLTLDKAEIEILSEDFDRSEFKKTKENIIPVYSLTEGLSAKVLKRAIKIAFENYSEKIKDFLPEIILKKHNLQGLEKALYELHFPTSEEAIQKSRYRLIYEEFFLLQLWLNSIKIENKKSKNTPVLGKSENGLVEKFINSLPFELTNGQKKALEEIEADLNSKSPMQRLLQGDVGSGKTVVACATLLHAIENGMQGAIMAPTEILAEQHYNNFVQWLTPLNISVGLFLGKQGVGARKESLVGIKNGQTHIAIGTHALIQENVEFNNLGIVVIDEQHRFGVKQRGKLLSKGKECQMLSMTATPIPRTLSLTLHGDLDVTTITELPKGRKPIITSIVTPSKMSEAYELIKNEIDNGHQAYIVLPLIEESETISAKCATEEWKKLQSGIFKNYKLGLLHGKLKNEEKEEVTKDFKNKKYDILVSTTVIEVGVDVPNATVMMIENSERFGLSQLHQLRGRIGRGSAQSYCMLTTTSSSKTTKERLNALVKSNDGFYIAQKDLELRGPGEFLGTKQSGLPEFRVADIVKDGEILELARLDAIEFLENNNIADFEEIKYEMDKKEIINNLKSG